MLNIFDVLDVLVKYVPLVLFLIITIICVACLAMWIVDRTQSKHAIKRNYPLIGRFRYLFEHLGGFFRQYFFAMDWEERPFNRAQRSWIYRAAKNIVDMVAFGSTRGNAKDGDVIFVNHPYPPLDEDCCKTSPIIVGPYCNEPWVSASFFGISGMSFGAISKPAIEALSKGARIAGTWLNTGEGGLTKYHLSGGADLIFQIGTAKYSVSDNNGDLCDKRLHEIATHPQVKMFELKISQGAKINKGGILPAEKVTPEIAEARGIPVGRASISPNRHKDIKCNSDLLDVLERIRRVTGKPVGFKVALGSSDWINQLAEDIRARGIESAPDFITLDSAGGDGGTGAAPMTLMDGVGMSIKESLPILIDALTKRGLKERIKVFVSGKLINPSDVAWALCSGADFCCSARGYMFALGCIQSLQCHKNTCPTGITTHDKKLQRGLVSSEKSTRVAYYTKNMINAVEVLAHSCGVSEPRQLNASHARVFSGGKSISLQAHNQAIVS